MSDEDKPRETEMQRKIRVALKKHPAKPGTTVKKWGPRMVSQPHNGIWAQYKAVAAEVGCSIGAVQAVERVERAGKIAQERQQERLEPLQFDVPATADVDKLVAGFPGWVFCFGKLSLLVNSYLQIARVTGASMPAAWLTNMRDLCETAQRRSEEDDKLRKLWANGAPAGSGHFPECKAIEHA